MSEEAERYFRDGLARLTGGDQTRPLVFLLSVRLLDVVERGETGDFLWLPRMSIGIPTALMAGVKPACRPR